MRWSEVEVSGDGVRLHVRRVVDPPAPPVLLLHGLGVNGAVWQSFARRLVPHLAAVAPDLRGHGQSDAPADGYRPADYAADLAQLIPALDIIPAGVVGHSLGALAGLALAEARPDLVAWLVLLDPPLDPDLPNPDVPNVYRLRHASPGQLEAYLLEQNPRGGPLLAEQLARMFRQASDGAFEALLRPDDRAGRAPESTVEALRAADRVQAPTLVIQADPTRGGVLGDSAARAFVQRLPRGKLVKVEGATHSLHASHPGDVAAAILTFTSAPERPPWNAI
jgi:pimeloyl-ACP methyl ester carboxylesterase